MNQYFERMKMLTENPELQPRIRFMLKDVIDLRHDGWVPRKAMVVEGPMPINQIGPVNEDRQMNFRRDRDDNRANVSELFRHPMKTRNGFDELFMSKCSKKYNFKSLFSLYHIYSRRKIFVLTLL